MKTSRTVWAAVAVIAFGVVAGCSPKPDSSGSGTAENKETGAIEAGKWTILDTRTDLADHARAKQNAEDALIKEPDLAMLVGLWSYNGPAILSAVKGSTRAGSVKIVCFDEEADTLQGVIDGQIYGTIVQQPYQFGYESVRVLSAIVRGDKSVVPESKVIEVPTMAIKQADARKFWDELNARLKGGGPAFQPKPDSVKIAFVTNNVSDFWKIAQAGINAAKPDYNAECEFQMPPDGTPADQQRIVEALMAKGTQGMAISPIDPANQKQMLDKAAAKMAVVTQDSDAPDSDRICYIGTNNYKAGREAGKLIKEALPEGGKIMLFVGRLDAQNAAERRQGIIDELSGKPEKP